MDGKQSGGVKNPPQYELRVDGDWQPAEVRFDPCNEPAVADDLATSDAPAARADRCRLAWLHVNEFNIRRVEPACGRDELLLRDDSGRFWTFSPRTIRFESDAYAEGEWRQADRPFADYVRSQTSVASLSTSDRGRKFHLGPPGPRN